MKHLQKRLLAGTALFVASLLLFGCTPSPAPNGNTDDTSLTETTLDIESHDTESTDEETSEMEETTVETEWQPSEDGIYLKIDTADKVKLIENKFSDMNMWSPNSWYNPLPQGHFASVYPFVENIQFMTATGGVSERDLFKDPSNKDVLDDYDFEPLITACGHVLDQGIKPMIKTGNIPQKYSTVSTIGDYGVNLYPPDDYNVYFNYIQALTQALVDEFGLEEVQSWRWGCFTEYENPSWFQGSCEDFCKIYDCTVAAVQSVLGFDIDIGAHSMTSNEGAWDEREFIDHCINGINYYTGEQGTRLTYLAISYYDSKITDVTAKTDRLASCMAVVRNQVKASIEAALASGIAETHLDKLGVTSIYYGVDEGRILWGNPGKDAPDLDSRIVGHTKQGAYDAMLLDLMVESDIRYFSAWGYHTDQYDGLPTVSYHVANEFYKMVGTTQVKSTMQRYAKEQIRPCTRWDALTSVDEAGNIYVMAYAFGEDGRIVDSDKLFHVLTGLDCQKARITVSYVNDDSNFFDEWMAVCQEGGLTQNDFSWSSDGTQLPHCLTTERAKQLFNENVTGGKNFTECSTLKTETVEVDVVGGNLSYRTTLEPNSVLFLKIEPQQ